MMRLARSAGWRVIQRNSSHWQWFNPQGELMLTTAHTSGDQYEIRKIRTCLRRAGVL